jgi:hypothetical protein
MVLNQVNEFCELILTSEFLKNDLKTPFYKNSYFSV